MKQSEAKGRAAKGKVSVNPVCSSLLILECLSLNLYHMELLLPS